MDRISVATFRYVWIYFMLTLVVACNTPEPTIFLASNIDQWNTQFKVDDEELWYIANGKLIFKGARSSSKLTLLLDSIPSDGLKPGRLTASVEVNGIFKDDYSDALYGFELSKTGTDKLLKLVLNGAGDIIAFDENLVALPIKVSRLEACTPKQDSDVLILSFAKYGYNETGWTFDLLVKNCEEERFYSQRAFIETPTKVRYDELSLIAYKPNSSDAPVSFSDLKIWKDWVPFD